MVLAQCDHNNAATVLVHKTQLYFMKYVAGYSRVDPPLFARSGRDCSCHPVGEKHRFEPRQVAGKRQIHKSEETIFLQNTQQRWLPHT